MQNSYSADAKVLHACEQLLSRILRGAELHGVTVRLWDGREVRTKDRQHTVVIQFLSPAALRTLLYSRNVIDLAQHFISGDIEVDGDLVHILQIVDAVAAFKPSGLSDRLAALLLWFQLPSSSARGLIVEPSSDLQGNSNWHYSLPISFWQSFLDRQLTYTCAYFRSGDETLDDAQLNKLEYVCKKLDIRPGDHLLDIGCGWGSLLTYAATRCAEHVIGITTSRHQADYVEQLLATYELQDKCQVEVCDVLKYQAVESFDKIAALGILEHISNTQRRAYFVKVMTLLRPGGLFLNQATCDLQRHSRDPTAGMAFIRRYIFPDGNLATIGDIVEDAQRSGLELIDVENLRPHYIRTARNWLDRLEANQGAAISVVGPSVVRTFRLYLAGFLAEFIAGRFQIFQTLFWKPHQTAPLPLTRNRWYQD